MARFNKHKALQRVYALLSIPFPHGAGTKSSTVTGFASFTEDMRYALPTIQEIIRQCYMGEDYAGSVEEVLTKLEAWHAARVQADWDFAHAGWKYRIGTEES